MSLKILIPSLGVAALVFSSCAPLTPYRPAPLPGTNPQQPVLTPEQEAAKKKAAEQERIEKARAEARAKAREREKELAGGNTSGGGTTTPDKPTTPSKPDYRRAIPIPGKEGFVFNPFTNNPVDVRGIPSGTLVRDPHDSNPAHKFRVP